MTRIILHFIWEKMSSSLHINSFLKPAEIQELCEVSFALFMHSKVFCIAKNIEKVSLRGAHFLRSLAVLNLHLQLRFVGQL